MADRRVRVETDKAGRLVSFELDPRAMRLPTYEGANVSGDKKQDRAR